MRVYNNENRVSFVSEIVLIKPLVCSLEFTLEFVN